MKCQTEPFKILNGTFSSKSDTFFKIKHSWNVFSMILLKRWQVACFGVILMISCTSKWPLCSDHWLACRHICQCFSSFLRLSGSLWGIQTAVFWLLLTSMVVMGVGLLGDYILLNVEMICFFFSEVNWRGTMWRGHVFRLMIPLTHINK